MKLDILAIGVHPDDVELSCSGTLMIHKRMYDHKVGVLDLTRGELGTRGSADLRDQEAAKAAKIMGLDVRENLAFRDGFFKNDEEHQLKLIEKIRLYQPDVVLTNALHDRHPDHGRAARLTYESCFLAGLAKVVTKNSIGEDQNPWRPRLLLHYLQDRWMEPNIMVDISSVVEDKVKSIEAYGTQFHDPNSKSNEPKTYISTPAFKESIFARSRELGKNCGFEFAEGFVVRKFLGVKNLKDLY